MREWFDRWGLPGSIRVDNGSPWGSKGPFPTDLALWLIGLGIEMIWNPPGQPQKNGVIERSQGTGKRWSEPARCESATELQQRLNELDTIHRSESPVYHGRSRREQFPDLTHSKQAYSAKEEPNRWSWNRVAAHLTQYVTPHTVDAGGQVSLYRRNHYVGKAYAGQVVYHSFDPTACEWIFRDERGTQLRTRPADELTANRIRTLQVTHQRGKTSLNDFQDTTGWPVTQRDGPDRRSQGHPLRS